MSTARSKKESGPHSGRSPSIYRRSFDYCLKCRKEVEKIREEFKKEIDYQYVLLDAGLRAGEERIFSGIKNRKKKKIEGGTNDITKNNKR